MRSLAALHLVLVGGRLGRQRPAVGLQTSVVLLDVSSHLLVLLLPLQRLASRHLLRGPADNVNQMMIKITLLEILFSKRVFGEIFE